MSNIKCMTMNNSSEQFLHDFSRLLLWNHSVFLNYVEQLLALADFHNYVHKLLVLVIRLIILDNIRMVDSLHDGNFSLDVI